ncbi:AraC family transcriptional regulator [Sphingobium cloacae]|nr:AraC family transcriptional regulator [Sphingobium cloacae]
MSFSHHAVPAGNGQATIRLLFLTALLEAVSDLGTRIDPVLREHGFSRSQLDRPYERVPLHGYVALIEHVATRFQRPYLGLEMGSSFGLADLGPLHALLQASGTLRAALDSLVLFQSRIQNRTLFESMAGADTASYCYRIEDHRIWPRGQDAEFAISGYTTLIRQLTTTNWAPVEVHFEHSIAGREKRLAQFFRAPVLGNQVTNALVIRNDDLDHPFAGGSPASNAKLRDTLEKHLLDLMGPEAGGDEGIVARTREIIERRLGRTHLDFISVAAEHNLSERSLRRRLNEAGTSFRLLLQEARQARARTMLEATDLPLAVAAEQLGYSDTATFSRAFKEWTGVSPGRFAKTPSVEDRE